MSSGYRPALELQFRATLGITLFHLAFEWLFFMTKPSFLTATGIGPAITVLAGAALWGSGALAILFAALWGVAAMGRFGPAVATLLGRLVCITAAVLAALSFLDTLSYSLARIGVEHLRGAGLLSAWLVLGLLFWDLWRRTARQERAYRPRGVGLIAVVTMAGLPVAMLALRSSPTTPVVSSCAPERKPNVLILSGDGISAERMSAYGYGRRTTPFIESLLRHAMRFENAFANSRRTTSSISSMLTGRLPTTTKVFYYPEVFRGVDAELHLPGLLRTMGYTTVDVTLRGIADAFELNMRNAFAEANLRSRNWLLAAGLSESATLFALHVWDRLTDRLGHLSATYEKQRFHEDILALGANNAGDSWRVERLTRLLRNSDEPLFVNTHLMGTHGRRFFPRQRHFSAGIEQNALWMDDYYDDAVLDFDRAVSEIFQVLREQGLLERTLVVITSDHTINSGFGRVPLLLFGPGINAGTITWNVQRLDIAPTVLDLLGCEAPSWMEGQSLLDGPLPSGRPLFFVNRVTEGRQSPPLRSLSSLGVVSCDEVGTINLPERKWRWGKVSGHTAPCGEREKLPKEALRVLTLEHLRGQGLLP